MQRYNTTRTVYAMQWRPDDPKARKAFLDELQELSDGVRELHEEHGWYESEDIIRTEIQETDECIMWACRAFGACCRKRAGRLQITYDHTDEIVLDPGMWLIYEWPRKYWLYAVSDDRFRAEYTLCTD